MSQTMRNQPGEGQGNPGEASNTDQDKKCYEGFEGMNYEQRRQPYDPEHANYKRRDHINSGDDANRRSEM